MTITPTWKDRFDVSETSDVYRPDSTVLSNGNVLVVFGELTGSGRHVSAVILDAFGNVVVPEFEITATEASPAQATFEAKVVADMNGGFFSASLQYNDVVSAHELVVEHFDSTGQSLQTETLFQFTTDVTIEVFDIFSNSSGTISVLAEVEDKSTIGSNSSTTDVIVEYVLDSNGVQIAPYTANTLAGADIIVFDHNDVSASRDFVGFPRDPVRIELANGDLITVYKDRDTNLSNSPDAEFTIRFTTSNAQNVTNTFSEVTAEDGIFDSAPAAVALATGGFAISWTDSANIFNWQVFDNAGNEMSSILQASYDLDGDGNNDGLEGLSMVALEDGTFVIMGHTRSTLELRGLWIDSTGALIDDIELNSTSGINVTTHMELTLDGRVMITWHDDGIHSEIIELGTTSPTTGGDYQAGSLADDNFTIASSVDAVDGGPGNDIIRGTINDDTIYGSDGDDHISGFRGDDSLLGGAGDDTLLASLGNDFLQGGAGADLIDGGQDIDTASYTDSDAAVTINLEAGTASGGHATGDTLVRIENLVGSDFDDHLTGDALDNVLSGGAGDDVLIGGIGGDAMDGGDGNDTASYENATTRVIADLLNPNAGFIFGEAIGDSYASIENLIGSDFNDQLRGDNGDNELTSGSFSDRLFGRAGDDVLNGEGGADALYGGLGVDVMTGGADTLRDRFIYFNDAESGVGFQNRDIITDFTSGEDRIEISRFDADSTVAGNQAFDFIGEFGFSGTAGELRYFKSAIDQFTVVQADMDGDGAADFEIELTGEMDLIATDFLL